MSKLGSISAGLLARMRSGTSRRALLCGWLVLVAACAQSGGDAGVTISGAQWPEADALFRQDPRWLGADGAFSIPLGDGRVLWLFGDSFVAKTPANVRSQSTMVRNSVAVQTGDDPLTAAMTFHWHGSATAPASFWPEDGDRWYWPQHGVRLGPALVVFLSRVKPTPGHGLGFEADGWRAAVIDDASGSPAGWTPRLVTPASSPTGLVVGAAVNVVGDHVIALAQREPGNHTGYLVRWRSDDLAAGRLDAAEWWAGQRGWVAASRLEGDPTPILDDAGPECSLHFDAALERWVHVRSDGFGATTIVVSFAPQIEGPWSKPALAFRPPESDRPDAFVYAAKGHPELRGADLVTTYATNTMAGFDALVRDTSIYYPRFVRLTLSAQ